MEEYEREQRPRDSALQMQQFRDAVQIATLDPFAGYSLVEPGSVNSIPSR